MMDLVFSDLALPGEGGLSLVQDLSSYRKDIPVLLTSGYQVTMSEWRIIQERGYAFLPKPYQLKDMLKSIRQVLQKDTNRL